MEGTIKVTYESSTFDDNILRLSMKSIHSFIESNISKTNSLINKTNLYLY